MNIRREMVCASVALALVSIAACSSGAATTAVGAGAAAAAAIGYESRGATSSIDVSVADLADAAEGAFMELGITRTDRKLESDGIEVQGEKGEWKYIVDIERDPDDTLTAIEVTVSKDQVDYSQDRAEDVLRAILARV